jgi:hypothetical protein
VRTEPPAARAISVAPGSAMQADLDDRRRADASSMMDQHGLQGTKQSVALLTPQDGTGSTIPEGARD